MKLMARPDETLEDHILNMISGFDKNILKKIDNRDIIDSIRISILLHDIGKSTGYFQEYLQIHKKNALTYHVGIGVLYTYITINKYLGNDKLALLSALAVSNHHSPQIVSYHKENYKNLQKIIEAIDEDFVNLLVDKFGIYGNVIRDAHNEIKLLSIKDIEICFATINYNFDMLDKGVEDFINFGIIASALYDLDTYDASGAKMDDFDNSIEIPIGTIDGYKIKQNFDMKGINIDRELVYSDVLDMGLDSDIYSISAPTGLGKTFAALNLAFRLKKHLSNMNNFDAKIIYNLPFIALADQIQFNIERIFDGILDVYNLMTVHHHLSTFDVKEKDIKDFYERWDNSLILTTNVRMFFTLFNCRKSDILRLNRLAGSIIIFDEVQSIPIKYWNVFTKVLKVLIKQYKCKIIFMSATQPVLESLISDVVIKGVNISPCHNRYQVSINLDRIDLKTFGDNVSDFLSLNKNDNVMVMLNTRMTARFIYNALKEKYDNVYYLSGDVVPIIRRKRIGDITKILDEKKNRIILVCTQVIEAGMDISFDHVFRDFAPLDSLIQTCGRCNRNFEIKQGYINVVNLISDKNVLFSKYVYGSVELDTTLKYLDGKRILNELELFGLCEQYYNDLKTSKNLSVGVSYVEGLEFKSIPEISIIKQQYRKSVFVICDEVSKKIYENILTDEFEWDKRFYSYIVNLSEDEMERCGLGNFIKYEVYKNEIYFYKI